MSTTGKRNPRSAFNGCAKETLMPTGRARLFVAFLLGMLALATCNVWAQATAKAKDDTYVTSASSTTNYGASIALVVQTGGSYSYIRFDLSGIPTVANGAAN